MEVDSCREKNGHSEQKEPMHLELELQAVNGWLANLRSEGGRLA